MVTWPSAEAALLQSNPVQYPTASRVGGRIHRSSNAFVLQSQAIGDVLQCVPLPAGAGIVAITMTTDTSLSTSTIAVGDAAAAAAYAAAAVLTATDTPTSKFNKTSARIAAPFAGTETVLLTVAVAALPATGNLEVDIDYTVA